MRPHTQILVIDFGSQYTQLIARRLRELGVFSEVCSCEVLPFFSSSLRGIVLSGGPHSIATKEEKIDLHLLPTKVPVLGICYGAQLIATQLGGKVEPRKSSREFGKAQLYSNGSSYLLADISTPTQVWMSHGDTISSLPNSLVSTARSDQIVYAAFESKDRRWSGLQFHPEVVHTTEGRSMLLNFVLHCGCSRDWAPSAFVDTKVAELQSCVGRDEQVIMALSGGVDSSVAAVLLQRAVGSRLRAVFVDNGLLRKNEYEIVLRDYASIGLQVEGLRAEHRFYTSLKGLSDPEEKRRAVGSTFIKVFEEAAKHMSNVKWLAQGTIYPDRIESLSTTGPSHTIKSHHNVGALPKKLPFKLIEPLQMLFKDEVREVGKALGLPKSLLSRHPFPGPGLSIRIIGEVSEEKVRILQAADAIFMDMLRTSGLYDQVWQAAAVLLPVYSVGVQGDQRSYAQVVALRAVVSKDGMTATSAPLSHDFLSEVSTQIINQVPQINRVVYDVSSKPPATIEWE